MTFAFILSAGVQTPVGRDGGVLSHVCADDLFEQSMVMTGERSDPLFHQIEDVAAGCVNPVHEGMGDIAHWGTSHEVRANSSLPGRKI